MSRTAVQTATALPRSPQQDRKSRMRKYSIAMSVRTLCLIGVVVVPDWWRFVLGAGAIFLPYVAVVLANVGSSAASTPVHPTQAGPLAIEQLPAQPTGATSAASRSVPEERLALPRPVERRAS